MGALKLSTNLFIYRQNKFLEMISRVIRKFECIYKKQKIIKLG